ncbi:MAG: glycosyltransferase [Phenylobacterium sp.]
MRVLITSVGTRGDVQPALALALALRDLGQTVRLCVPPNFVEWAADLGFEARPVGVEMRAPRPGEAPARVPDLITDQFEVVGAAAEGCSLIVGAGVHQYAARSIAERRGVAYVDAVYAPVSLPSPDLAPSGPDRAPQTPEEVRRLWAETRRGWNARALERVNANRARLDLPPIEDVLDHILAERPWLAADPVLGPAPSTPGRQVVQTGAWVLNDARGLDPNLERFLAAGEPPLYLGFGSMPAAPDAGRALIDAARAVGRRAILSRGWAELQLIDNGEDCIAVGDVSHAALFPRVGAVVHHAGAGTTTAAALAGAPQIAVPMFGDQFYWARRVERLGIGSTTPAAGLDAARLADSLNAALQAPVSAKARALAGRVSADGADAAARRLVSEFG